MTHDRLSIVVDQRRDGYECADLVCLIAIPVTLLVGLCALMAVGVPLLSRGISDRSRREFADV